MVPELGLRMLNTMVRAAAQGFDHDRSAVMAIYQGLGHQQDELDRNWEWVEDVLALSLPPVKMTETAAPSKKARRKAVDNFEEWT